jgi:virginiamycin B lyase
MVDLAGSPDKDAIAGYLTQHFPPNARRKPTLVPGDAKITFKEWKVPTLGQRSRDPEEAPDGSIWGRAVRQPDRAHRPAMAR